MCSRNSAGPFRRGERNQHHVLRVSASMAIQRGIPARALIPQSRLCLLYDPRFLLQRAPGKNLIAHGSLGDPHHVSSPVLDMVRMPKSD